MIIMEGPDGSGKSTTGTILAKCLKKEVFHSGGPVKDQSELYSRIRTQLSKRSMIIDRCSVFSEPVYGLTLKGNSLLSMYDFDDYIKKMVIAGWHVVYCCAKGKIETNKEWKDKEHMLAVINNRKMIHEGYDLIMKRAIWLGLKVTHWDWTKYTKSELKIAYNWLMWELT